MPFILIPPKRLILQTTSWATPCWIFLFVFLIQKHAATTYLCLSLSLCPWNKKSNFKLTSFKEASLLALDLSIQVCEMHKLINSHQYHGVALHPSSSPSHETWGVTQQQESRNAQPALEWQYLEWLSVFSSVNHQCYAISPRSTITTGKYILNLNQNQIYIYKGICSFCF